MADPLTIGMIMASLAGTGMQSMAARQDAEAKNRARHSALRAGIERSREFEEKGLALTRKAAEEERELGEMSAQKKGEALALMKKANQRPPASRLGGVQAAQRGQASESAAQVIGSQQGTGAMKRRHAQTLMPLKQIIENARRDWGVSQQEAFSAGNRASGGGGLMTIGTLLKLAPMAGLLPEDLLSRSFLEAGTIPSTGALA